MKARLWDASSLYKSYTRTPDVRIGRVARFEKHWFYVFRETAITRIRWKCEIHWRFHSHYLLSTCDLRTFFQPDIPPFQLWLTHFIRLLCFCYINADTYTLFGQQIWNLLAEHESSLLFSYNFFFACQNLRWTRNNFCMTTSAQWTEFFSLYFFKSTFYTPINYIRISALIILFILRVE